MPTANWRGLLLILAAVIGVPGQNFGRFAALTGKGIELVNQGRFREAENALSEVWENGQSDSAVAENLAMAILYGDHDAARAQELMETSLALGGRASFLMQHTHEKGTVISMDTSDFCSGRLSIYPDHLAFISQSMPEHSFSVPYSALKEMKRNKWFGSKDGILHIRTNDNRNYNLRPRTWSTEESSLVLFFMNKFARR